MKKLFINGLMFLCVFCLLNRIAFADPKKLEIVTTTPDLKSITEYIGGEQVDVLSLTTGTQNPHFIDPKPSYMVKARKADLFISNGLDLEMSWQSSIIEGSRNPRIKVGTEGYLDASKGIEPLEIPQHVDRSMGDIHPLGNPHYLLDPVNAKIVARNIAERLSELSPSQTAYFQKRLEEFSRETDQRMAVWQNKLAAFKGEKIITYHKTWHYFARRFGLKTASQLEPKPGIPPSAAHLQNIIQLIKEEKIKIILQENVYKDDAAQFVSERSGAKVIKAPIAVGGAKGTGDYFTLIDTVVEMIAKGFAA